MGRLRNLSQSLKAAAFPHSIGGGSPSSSPVIANSPLSPTDSPIGTTKQAPVITREASSTSTLVPAITTVTTPTTTTTTTTPTTITLDHPGAGRSESRSTSRFYDPPTMGAGREDQIEELKPVFSHQNKLYQEGYFLKLNDLDTHGNPNTDRNWTECFAQLVGTVLSLWDAAALDAAGQDGEVSPMFINLADASIKMIETLPTRNNDVEPLQNVLSVSTAGKNRYLLHFNSLHSLTQWTAGFRLSMFEHASLHELYTGSLIAGKGKTLNNIRQIMEKSRFRVEDWCRVRFGAGTPWRRCWFVIEPPDEKEWQKVNKQLKKKGAYERVAYPRGDLKFYDSKKTKKVTPIATITDVYAAYAVYPESKPLIDQSTLVKLEGNITIHSKPESQTEGFVFIMPEVHPAVSGFEILLRFLFPIYDTFNIYGRPNRLIADTLDSRGLMFAMPKNRRYGYLDIIDVAGLIHTEGSAKWSEREWRKETKDMVSRRMTGAVQGRYSESDSVRRSLGSRPAIRFGNSSPTEGEIPNQSTDAVFRTVKKTHTAPPAAQSTPSIKGHVRSVSETISSMSPTKRKQAKDYTPSKLAYTGVENSYPQADPAMLPPSPTHRQVLRNAERYGNEVTPGNNYSDTNVQQTHLDPQDVSRDLPVMTPPTPVAQPTFNHQANDQPVRRPRDRPDLRREKSRMSSATLSQMVDANKSVASHAHAGAAAAAAWSSTGRQEDYDGRGVNYFHNPEDIRRQANLAGAAMNADYSPNPDSTAVLQPQPVPRPGSAHSILRKPLPTTSRPVTPGTTDQHEDPFIGMEDPVLPSDLGSVYLPGMMPTTTFQRSGGVRKTVGNPKYEEVKRKSDIPDVDFGVTRSLSFNSNQPTSRPGTGTGGRRSPLAPAMISPAQTPPEGRRSPYGLGEHMVDRSRPVSQMWQPGSQPAGRQSPGTLTPEEFVQRRAAAARTPYGYSARRNPSPTQPDPRPHQRPSPQVSLSPTPKKLQKRSTGRPTSSESHYSNSTPAAEPGQLPRMAGGPLFHTSERQYAQDMSFGQELAHRQQYPPPQHMPQNYPGQHPAYQQQAPTGYQPQQFPGQYPPHEQGYGNFQQY